MPKKIETSRKNTTISAQPYHAERDVNDLFVVLLLPHPLSSSLEREKPKAFARRLFSLILGRPTKINLRGVFLSWKSPPIPCNLCMAMAIVTWFDYGNRGSFFKESSKVVTKTIRFCQSKANYKVILMQSSNLPRAALKSWKYCMQSHVILHIEWSGFLLKTNQPCGIETQQIWTDLRRKQHVSHTDVCNIT